MLAPGWRRIREPQRASMTTRRETAASPPARAGPGTHIQPDDEKKFIEIARDITQASVVLNSKGGYVQAAINIGRFIRLRNYETRMHDGAVCNSACSLIWLAGTFRHLDRRVDWLKMKNSAAPAVKREAEEDWGR
jgi:hypothetical protein